MALKKPRPVDQDMLELVENDKYLDGQIKARKVDGYELDAFYSGAGTNRRFHRNIQLGHTAGNWSSWSHVKQLSGYSIWKYPVTGAAYRHDTLNQVYLDDVLLENRGQATAESATAFNKVYLYDGIYNDHTTEAGTEAGTAFSLNDATDEYLYIGDNEKFEGVDFDFDVVGVGHNLVIQFYNGSWKTINAVDNSLVDDTANWTNSARISWDALSDWATTAINSQTKYWIRISTSSTPSTVAKALSILPQGSVATLLSLSSDEQLDEDWAWCFYNNWIYATIRNAGKTYYEGSYHLSATPSSTNKENFFRFNHEYKIDYVDEGWEQDLKTTLVEEFADGSSGNLSKGHITNYKTDATVIKASSHDDTKPAYGITVGGSGAGTRKVSLAHGIIPGVFVEEGITITRAEKLYLSTGAGVHAGKVTDTQPAYTGSIVQRIGIAKDAAAGGIVTVMEYIEVDYTTN